MSPSVIKRMSPHYALRHEEEARNSGQSRPTRQAEMWPVVGHLAQVARVVITGMANDTC
jgi:hypothetical protein